MSLATYPLVQDTYILLPHGASLGSGYGPIVVAQEGLSLEELRETEIVVPGKLTTAFLVLKMALGGEFESRVLPFDQILPEVASGAAKAGLLIHEGQLTYLDEGSRSVSTSARAVNSRPRRRRSASIRRAAISAPMLSVLSRSCASIDAGLEHREAAPSTHSASVAAGRGPRRPLHRRYVNEPTQDW
jgi:1,4-dihydroxy-6-naphthoate synthase